MWIELKTRFATNEQVVEDLKLEDLGIQSSSEEYSYDVEPMMFRVDKIIGFNPTDSDYCVVTTLDNYAWRVDHSFEELKKLLCQ